jgi:hypothetical protein
VVKHLLCKCEVLSSKFKSHQKKKKKECWQEPVHWVTDVEDREAREGKEGMRQS